MGECSDFVLRSFAGLYASRRAEKTSCRSGSEGAFCALSRACRDRWRHGGLDICRPRPLTEVLANHAAAVLLLFPFKLDKAAGSGPCVMRAAA